MMIMQDWMSHPIHFNGLSNPSLLAAHLLGLVPGQRQAYGLLPQFVRLAVLLNYSMPICQGITHKMTLSIVSKYAYDALGDMTFV